MLLIYSIFDKIKAKENSLKQQLSIEYLNLI